MKASLQGEKEEADTDRPFPGQLDIQIISPDQNPEAKSKEKQGEKVGSPTETLADHIFPEAKQPTIARSKDSPASEDP